MTSKDVQIAHWNPKRRRFKGRISRLIPLWTPVNNFGDLLGPMITNKILVLNGATERKAVSFEELSDEHKLLSVGSVLHFARDGDIIWGAGRNGKVSDDAHSFSSLDVRMVRGPKTRAFLTNKGIDVPEIYGDPALLFPDLFEDRMTKWKKGIGGLSILPNLNDLTIRSSEGRLINPRSEVWSVLQAIYESEVVVASSLHGFILAEAFGVKARLLRSHAESDFKYQDYLEGTGRHEPCTYNSVREAISASDHPPPIFSVDRMRSAFPIDRFVF